MNYIHISFLFLIVITISQAFSNIIYLENCTYSIDLYKKYLNVLWSSNDSRILHIQAIYSLSLNKSSIPGQIFTYSSQLVVLIPFLIQCQSFKNQLYLPFTQCSSTIMNRFLKKNYESTRINLNLEKLFSMNNVPLLYLGEYDLILFNCSFKMNSTIYQLKSHEIFSFRIKYESSILSDCYSCNRRTSICYENLCQCRLGTKALKLYQNKQFCVDITKNCTLDSQRCLYTKLLLDKNYSNELIILLIILISFIFILFLSLLCCLYRNLNEKNNEISYLNQSLDNKHERTSSTISTIDSIKLSIENQYPQIIGEENNGEIVYILV